jgi:protein SMG7
MIDLYCIIILEVLHIILLRGNISPTVSPSVLATPITTPVKPMLSPKNVAPRSSNPPAPAAPMVPTTTAQDLLNNVINFGAGGGSGRTMSGLSESTAPQPTFLFGSELSHRPSQSIWSASRDEHPLLYSGNGSAPGQIYQTSPRQFAAVIPSSQDLSQKSTWPSTISGQSQNPQQYLIGALPSESFAHPPHSTLIGGGGGGHHRRPSSSMTAQLFPTQSLAQNDPFVYASPTLQHRQPVLSVKSQLPPTSSSDYLNSSGFGGSGGVTAAADAVAQYYTTTSGSSSYHHSRQVSMHNSRQDYLPPPMSQMWSNMG